MIAGEPCFEGLGLEPAFAQRFTRVAAAHSRERDDLARLQKVAGAHCILECKPGRDERVVGGSVGPSQQRERTRVPQRQRGVARAAGEDRERGTQDVALDVGIVEAAARDVGIERAHPGVDRRRGTELAMQPRQGVGRATERRVHIAGRDERAMLVDGTCFPVVGYAKQHKESLAHDKTTFHAARRATHRVLDSAYNRALHQGRRSPTFAALDSTPVRIAIADDHPLMRAALASALATLAPAVEFVEACDHDETLALLERTPAPDILLMDLHMPGARGVDSVREVRRRAPQVPLAIVSADDDPAAVRALLAQGIAGFIPKTDSPTVIASAVRLILAGGVYVPPALVAGPSAPARAAELAGLTERQVEVVRLLARGLSNKGIARELGVSEGTVKVHLLAVFRALDVRNRTSAVLAAQRFLS